MIIAGAKTWPIKADLRLGFASILTVSMVVVIVLVMTLTTLLDIRRSRNVFRADQGERGLLLANTLNEVMAGMVYFADVDGLNNLAETIGRSQPDLIHVQVYTNSRRVLAHEWSPRYSAGPRHPDPNLDLPIENLPVVRFGETGLEIFSPLKLGPETVGVLNLGFGEAKLRAAIRTMVIQHLWQGAFLVTMGFLLAFLIARHVTRPLKDLAVAAAEFGQGNLDTPTPITGATEVSVLGGVLEAMRLELRGQYHGLESQVAQRTQELSITNDELKKESAERKNTERQLAGLFEVSGAMGQPGSMIEKSQAVLQKVSQIAQADWVILRVAEDDGLRLVAVEGHAVQGEPPEEFVDDPDSMSMQVFRSGQHMLISQDSPNAGIRASAIGQGMKSGVALALNAGGTPMGVLTVFSAQDSHFPEEKVNLLAAIADGLGVLLENANLYQRLVSELTQRQRTQDELAALFEVAGAMGQPGSFEEKSKAVMKKVAHIAQAGWVTMRVPSDQGLKLVAVEGEVRQDWHPLRLVSGQGTMSNEAFQKGEFIVRNDYPTHENATANSIRLGIKSMVSLPLKASGTPMGLMNVLSSETGHFTPERVNLLVAIADGLGVMMENGRLYEQLVQELDQRQLVEDALRESEGNLQALVNSAVAGIVTIDESGTVESFNPAAEVLFGYTAAEVIGSPVTKLMPLPHSERHGEYMRRYSETGESKILGEVTELLAQHHDGTIFPIELAVSEVDLGHRRTFTGVIRDISARKRAEEELALRAMALEAANHELETFSYSVSHDLRAPLRSIDGFSQALLEDYSGVLDDEGQGYLRRVRASSQRMAGLIDDLLELSRVTRSALNREQVDLTSLAWTIAADLQITEPKRAVKFEIVDGLVDKGDPRLLRVVLENLFRNAWKFTSTHPDALIRFGFIQAEDKHAYYVSDDGAGFDMAYADKLFGTFQRLHSTEEFEGTGIGLATVQRIIHRHGGRVWAEGQVDQGATFYFTI